MQHSRSGTAAVADCREDGAAQNLQISVLEPLGLAGITDCPSTYGRRHLSSCTQSCPTVFLDPVRHFGAKNSAAAHPHCSKTCVSVSRTGLGVRLRELFSEDSRPPDVCSAVSVPYRLL